MRELLVASAAGAPVGLNWDVRRLDGKRFYAADETANPLLARPVSLWEAAGELVGFILPESANDAHLQVHPDYRHLEDEMIAWAEANLAGPATGAGGRELEIYVYEWDAQRQRLLQARGFVKTEVWGMLRHLRLGRQPPLPAPEVPVGYTLRATRAPSAGPSTSSGGAGGERVEPRPSTGPSTSSGGAGGERAEPRPSTGPSTSSGGGEDDCQRIADLLNAAFGRTFHNAAEYRNFTRHAPCFRRELDLVVEAPDGTLAAYVGIPYDPVNRCGIFEPVCTHPDHRRRGLAAALMQEGLRRLRAIGAVEATVDTGDRIPANRFYDSLGFTEAYRGFTWRKVF
jgi:GNAT superfamily N-acetyltransferase